MVRGSGDVGRRHHVDNLGEGTVEESILRIYLMEWPTPRISDYEQEMNSRPDGNWSKCLIVDPMLLSKALRDKMRLLLLHLAIRSILDLVDPFGASHLGDKEHPRCVYMRKLEVPLSWHDATQHSDLPTLGTIVAP